MPLINKGLIIFRGKRVFIYMKDYKYKQGSIIKLINLKDFNSSDLSRMCRYWNLSTADINKISVDRARYLRIRHKNESGDKVHHWGFYMGEEPSKGREDPLKIAHITSHPYKIPKEELIHLKFDIDSRNSSIKGTTLAKPNPIHINTKTSIYTGSDHIEYMSPGSLAKIPDYASFTKGDMIKLYLSSKVQIEFGAAWLDLMKNHTFEEVLTVSREFKVLGLPVPDKSVIKKFYNAEGGNSDSDELIEGLSKEFNNQLLENNMDSYNNIVFDESGHIKKNTSYYDGYKFKKLMIGFIISTSKGPEAFEAFNKEIENSVEGLIYNLEGNIRSTIRNQEWVETMKNSLDKDSLERDLFKIALWDSIITYKHLIDISDVEGSQMGDFIIKRLKDYSKNYASLYKTCMGLVCDRNHFFGELDQSEDYSYEIKEWEHSYKEHIRSFGKDKIVDDCIENLRIKAIAWLINAKGDEGSLALKEIIDMMNNSNIEDNPDLKELTNKLEGRSIVLEDRSRDEEFKEEID